MKKSLNTYIMIFVLLGTFITIMNMIYHIGKSSGRIEVVTELINIREVSLLTPLVPVDYSEEPYELIWNDDDEGLPAAGSHVQIQLIENNKVYIGNIDDSLFIN